MENIIEIKNLSKSFNDVTVLKNLNFKISKNTIHGLLGKNGAGKTTLIKSILGSIIPDEGEILINNIDSSKFNKRSRINYVPERLNLDWAGVIEKNLLTLYLLSGFKFKQAKAKTKELLKNIGLYEKRNNYFTQLSSGQKQKLVLYSTLILESESKILILDEPASNLDPTERTLMYRKIKKLKDSGYTILISTHILPELEGIADEITIINDSKISYNGLVKGKEIEKIWFEKTKQISEKDSY